MPTPSGPYVMIICCRMAIRAGVIESSLTLTVFQRVLLGAGFCLAKVIVLLAVEAGGPVLHCGFCAEVTPGPKHTMLRFCNEKVRKEENRM